MSEEAHVQVPPIGTVLELTEGEKETIVALREQHRLTKMKIADTILRIMRGQDELIGLRQELAKLEDQLNKVSGDLMASRGLDIKKSGAWDFQLSTLTLKRVG